MSERPLVEVKNLKQYFPIRTGFFTTTPLKAVDDISESIKDFLESFKMERRNILRVRLVEAHSCLKFCNLFVFLFAAKRIKLRGRAFYGKILTED